MGATMWHMQFACKKVIFSSFTCTQGWHWTAF